MSEVAADSKDKKALIDEYHSPIQAERQLSSSIGIERKVSTSIAINRKMSSSAAIQANKAGSTIKIIAADGTVTITRKPSSSDFVRKSSASRLLEE